MYRIVCFLFLVSTVGFAVQARNLNLNTTSDKARCLVYELPDDKDKAAAIDYITSIRNRFFKGFEILDAKKHSVHDLKKKLAEGFILYTVLSEDSQLLLSAGKPLGLKIEKGHAKLGDKSAPVSSLRTFFVGLNPYGSGFCSVYAAGNNQELKGINNLFHGPRSFHLYHKQKLIAEGDYDSNFVFQKESIAFSEALEDIQQFFNSLQRVHPDLLAKMDADSYLALRRKIVDDVVDKLDKNRKILVEDLAYFLAYAAASFGDGHTSVRWTKWLNEQNTRGERFFPLVVEFRNGKFFVAVAKQKKLEGLEVTDINGQPILKFLVPIFERCAGETLPFRAHRFTHNQGFWWSFTKLLKSKKAVRIAFKDKNGRITNQQLKTIYYSEYEKLIDKWHGRIGERKGKQETRIAFYDNGKIAHLSYPSFRYNESEMKKIDEIFVQIRKKDSVELILDIRGNGGGNSSMGDYIFKYIYDKPFRSFSQMRVKISEDMLAKGDYYSKYADLKGMVITRSFQEQKPKSSPEAFFHGKITLLVDNGSFSSASDFAAMFRDYRIGKIIGYETGGIATCFGDVFRMVLRHSRIPYGVSYKHFMGPNPKPGDDKHGILPDISFDDNKVNPFAKHRDPVLEFTLDHIRKNR